MPTRGQEIVVIGQIQKRLGGTKSIATQVFTNPADIHQILAQGSNIPSPGKRPGDNLWREATAPTTPNDQHSQRSRDFLDSLDAILSCAAPTPFDLTPVLSRFNRDDQ
jgi:hypothetical protein